MSHPPTNEPAADLSTADILAEVDTVRKRLVRLGLQAETPLSDTEKSDVRADLAWLNEASEYQTLGICADSLSSAEKALKAYVAALSQPIQVDLPEADPAEAGGGVFLKFNTLKNAWYLDGYSGSSRGVLVTYHTSEAELDAVNGTYGPFPLDLFD